MRAARGKATGFKKRERAFRAKGQAWKARLGRTGWFGKLGRGHGSGEEKRLGGMEGNEGLNGI